MHINRLEPKWVDLFERIFTAVCALKAGEVVAILSESQSRRVLVEIAEMAAARLGARIYHVVVPTPSVSTPIPPRSTGSSQAIGGLKQVIDALAGADLVLDCTIEGLLHSPERPKILERGARIFFISNEHPEVFERCLPVPGLREKCDLAGEMITAAKCMRVTSAAGTNLVVDLSNTVGRGSAGYADKPGSMGYWPAGLVVCFPPAHTSNGTVVLAPGDANLTFKRYIEAPVELVIKDDFVVDIRGNNLDSALLRSHFASWNERDAYAVSHVGWGMNPAARWDTMIMYDRGDFNGTELRAFAGNFLFSTGANPSSGRYSACHFDIPMGNCTVELDDQVVVRDGVLQGELVI